MSYTIRPRPSGDTLVESRDPIRTNFEVIQDRFDENHVGIDNGSGGGKHKFLQMPEQSAAPGTAASNEGALYTKENGFSKTGLYFQEENSGSSLELSGVRTGTINMKSTAQTIEEMPANSWGYVWAQQDAEPQRLSVMTFMCTATLLFGGNMNNSPSISGSSYVLITQQPGNLEVKLRRNSTDLSPTLNGNWTYKIIYWTFG